MTAAPKSRLARVDTPAPVSGPGVHLPNDPNPEKPAIVVRLEEKHADLFNSLGILELDEFALPAATAIKSDEDAAKVTAFAKKVREKAREAERIRKEEKDDFLRLGQSVDALFNKTLKDPLLKLAEDAEKRLVPYLTAKAEAAAAELRARQEAQARASEEARKREEEARAAAAEAARAAADAAEKIRAAKDEETRAAAADELQAAEARRQVEQDAADQAATDTARSERLVGQQEKVLSGGTSRLSKTKVSEEAGAGSANLVETWIHSITDPAALDASLGPLAPFLPAHVLTDALQRVAREHKDALPIPGVVFSKDLEREDAMKNPNRSPAVASFFRKLDREGRWNGQPRSLAAWYEGPTEGREITQETLARFLSTAYAEGRAFEKRKADRGIERLGRFYENCQNACDKALDRVTAERDQALAELLRARPLIEKARSFSDLIADVQWLLHGARLVLSKKRLDRLELPSAAGLSDLRDHLDRLNPAPKKDLPF